MLIIRNESSFLDFDFGLCRVFHHFKGNDDSKVIKVVSAPHSVSLNGG